MTNLRKRKRYLARMKSRGNTKEREGRRIIARAQRFMKERAAARARKARAKVDRTTPAAIRVLQKSESAGQVLTYLEDDGPAPWGQNA